MEGEREPGTVGSLIALTLDVVHGAGADRGLPVSSPHLILS